MLVHKLGLILLSRLFNDLYPLSQLIMMGVGLQILFKWLEGSRMLVWGCFRAGGFIPHFGNKFNNVL